MDVYVLDENLRRIEVVDYFESMIWTERYSAYGDFELVTASTSAARQLLTKGTRLAINESRRVMTVETVTDAEDKDGKQMLTVTGPSLEQMFEDRSSRKTMTAYGDSKKTTWVGLPAEIARSIFSVGAGPLSPDPDDRLPFYVTGNLYPVDSLAEPDTSITYEYENISMYEALKNLCDNYGMGFRVYRGLDNSRLYFNVYTGNDRTTGQTARPAVVFGVDLDNLSNPSELSSIAKTKNVAYVSHPWRFRVVKNLNAPAQISGFDRRVLQVDGSDVELPERPLTISDPQVDALNKAGQAAVDKVARGAFQKLLNKERISTAENTALQTEVNSLVSAGKLTGSETTLIGTVRDAALAYDVIENGLIDAALDQRGLEELAKNRSIQAFDGEVPQTSSYKYGVHYQLGDLVEIRNGDGLSNRMRVTEQIFVSDAEGERAYPTLTTDLLVTTGSWLSWSGAPTWDLATGTWDEQ